jgi:hypothetical protein
LFLEVYGYKTGFRILPLFSARGCLSCFIARGYLKRGCLMKGGNPEKISSGFPGKTVLLVAII